MRVIGTAGHVDHGKSTLIQALTGIHPDRLKEEQEREMTIDLGFAWWQLPNGEEVGVVDVPGHRDFIENMLAGIGGIDGVLFVVAADEGVMPQTREHLAILDLLQVKAGVVALTKIDLVKDESWLGLVEEDLRQTLQGTALAQARIVPVSAKTGEGLDELQSALEEVLAVSPLRPDLGRPRLPIDRVFTIAGFGTVVTGTLSDGSFKTGDEVEILPGAIHGRVRGLQNHKRKVEVAYPSSRTAMNISGVDANELQRGQVVTLPGTVEATRRLDVHIHLLPDVSQPLQHDTEVKLFLGAAEVLARLRLLGEQELKPGSEGWLQLELLAPLVARRGDRYILRRPSPAETLGGGIVLDPHPKERYKRFSPEVIQRLETLTAGSPLEVFSQALAVMGVAEYKDVLKQSNLPPEQAQPAFEELLDSGQAVILFGSKGDLNKATISSKAYWVSLGERAVDVLLSYHQKQPLRWGMLREELKSRLNLSAQIFNLLLVNLAADGEIQEKGNLVKTTSHQVFFSSAQQAKIDPLMARFARSPFSPPTVKECQEALDERIFQALLDLDELVLLSADVVFRRAYFLQAVEDIRELIQKNGSVSLAHARNHWNTSRRYVQALLEYMDSQGVTVRKGDVRVLKG